VKLSVIVVLDGEYVYTGFGMTVPVSIGQEGFRKIIELSLEPSEREALETPRSGTSIPPHP
jgi:malate/lactate dehydrogenase